MVIERMTNQQIPINTIEERLVLAEALNLYKEKYRTIEEKGGNHVKNARHRQNVAQEMAGRLPPVNAFDTPSVNNESHLRFFGDAGTSFKSITPQSFLATRKAGDIKVARRFRVDLDTSKLSVKEGYYFGDYNAKEDERDLGRVQNVKRHTDNPLWGAKKDGTRLKDYCKSIHAQSVSRDDRIVLQILEEDPKLDPTAWRERREP